MGFNISVIDKCNALRCFNRGLNKNIKKMRTCDICNKNNANEEEDDALLYGEWMVKQNVTVHYYCLLLSSNLPQRGGDSSGILGFLLRDIRQEAVAAQKRKCAFCREKGASVICFKCRIVFHMICGLENRCVYQFCDDFRSYCENCAPMDDYKRQLVADPPKSAQCDICFRPISPFLLHNVTYGDCCRKGFAHRTCMRRYALASGYYLRCLWCRSKTFHDNIRLQSVFVPDRDATWERQPNAYSELHNRRMRCEQAICLCPKGRDFNRNTWIIQPCILCAAVGTHYKCYVGTMRLSRASANEPNNFKCNMCAEVEAKLQQPKQQLTTSYESIDSSFYMPKNCNELSVAADDDSPVLSEDESSLVDATIITIKSSQRLNVSCEKLNELAAKESQQLQEPQPLPAPPIPVESSVIELPDSQPISTQQLLADFLKPPLPLRESFFSDGYFYLVVYEYNEKLENPCVGSCTLRFSIDDKRLGDFSEETLMQLQLVETDVWYRESDRGVYDKIDQYIENNM
ncbi:PREDICTED: G2/M phase-specific E3 ubiquitin-protein ligase [Drosophila arizonae]|uniref:G2/M phase-specific E3 ubiquitin-protein ligase n=1 Tax=Drosophila arizonae TaxID=7263 RepID=A0ABM1PV06_DROAR|nr:PREDICTED: G2/M phase-specific E3 ubiquitin-protein ligase [Drosophila arizonae]